MAAEENALRNYNRSLFYISASVAHEVMHAFLGYLNGYAPLKTPDSMGHPSQAEGESGWWFEGNAFGGGIFMAENREDPLGLRQAGTPYLLDKQSMCTRISETFVQNVVNDSKFRNRFDLLESPRAVRGLQGIIAVIRRNLLRQGY